MSTPKQTADYALTLPAVARGRFLTAARHLDIASRELCQLIGYLDAGKAEARYLELGITEIESQLLKVIRAIDMMPEPRPR